MATTKLVKGNVKKYQSYTYANSKIKLAIVKKFYIEAIAIEESIISDRLISFLTAVSPTKKRKYGSEERSGLNRLIRNLDSSIKK